MTITAASVETMLADFYHPASVARGRAYAAAGKAQVLDAGAGRLRAVCSGTARASYLVEVRWSSRGSIVTEVSDSCTCPVGEACKHCVAALLTAAATVSAAEPDWRTALSALPAGEPSPSGGAELALEAGLFRAKANRYQPEPPPQLTLRPLRRGKTGRWVRTNASWRDIASPYRGGQAELDERHVEVMRAIVSGSKVDPYYLHTQDLPLGQLGPEVWTHLDRAAEVGIELVGGQGVARVDLVASAARAEVDLTANLVGDITLSTHVMLHDEPLDVHRATVGLVGSPAHGLWRVDGGHLSLIRFDRPLHAAVSDLLVGGELLVPSGDVDELLDKYQPALARHAAVRSSDGSVKMAASRFEGLVLRIERVALTVAEVRWLARYRRDDRVTDRPLNAPGGIGRDLAAEQGARAALSLERYPSALVDELGRPVDAVVSGPEIVDLLDLAVSPPDGPDAITVEIVSDERLPELRPAESQPLVSLDIRDSAAGRAGNDWFDLGVEVSVDGEEVDFVSLFTALDAGDEVLVLPSGTWLSLDQPELLRLRELIEEARGLIDPSNDGVARVNRFQTSWWDELASLGVVREQSERWAQSIGQMRALGSPEPVEPSPSLRAELRPYQQEGLDWLAFLHRHGLGGILADDMGLGKTLQTLALFLHVIDENPDARFLVVAPTSVVDNWAREAERFAPALRVRTIANTQARRGTPLGEAVAGAELVVTSYALFRLEAEAYEALDWEILVLDEAQFVKNHQGKTYQCVRRLPAATKLAITGTPLENTLMDLWALLSITAPGLYPDPKRFSDTYRKPIEAGDAPELLATLRRRMAPLMRRRTKDAVLDDLPPKTEQTIEVPLGAKHAKIYATQLQRQRQKVLGLVGDVDRNRFEILKSLTLLRQLALDPGLIDEDDAKVGSAKLDRLVEDLTQVLAEGHRALVFSQFTRYLAKVRSRLDAAGIEHAYLDGRTRDRPAAIARFKDDGAPVFVISLKAGGFGLNLTEADYCFVLDPWWNPATETQAVDRTHRIGQTNPVMVYRYVSTDTIEEKVMELKARKAALFANVMDADGGALAGALSASDIRGLLDLS